MRTTARTRFCEMGCTFLLGPESEEAIEKSAACEVKQPSCPLQADKTGQRSMDAADMKERREKKD